MIQTRFVFGLGLLTVGYVLGAVFHPAPNMLHAQAASQTGLERETLVNFQLMHQKMSEVVAELEGEAKYTSGVDGTNAFAASVGGVDALKDLEENRGVDPETFGALYAGRASPEVFPHLGTDENGRVTYKDKVVRMYSRERLRKLYSRRDQLLRAR
ncbi:MAG: hypothetical protein AB8G99_15535 [Planctomycetaceae bacterium]